ncbi:PRC-barrel domain-containing protein [Tistrella bauzanensis]
MPFRLPQAARWPRRQPRCRHHHRGAGGRFSRHDEPGPGRRRTRRHHPPAGAEDTAEAPPEPQPANTLLSSDAVVRTPDGEEVATLRGLIFDPNGQITHAVLGYGGLLGFGTKEVMVPWDQLTAEPGEQVLVASMTPEQLEQMPAFKSAEAVKSDAEAGAAQPMTTTAPAPAG